MTRKSNLAVTVVCLLATSLSAQTPAKVETSAITDGTIKTLTLPGQVSDTAAACHQQRCFGLLLLTRSDQQSHLWLYDATRPSHLEKLSSEIPPAAQSLMVLDVDHDGRSDILLAEPGKIHHIGTVGKSVELTTPRLLVESPSLRSNSLERRGLVEEGRIAVAELRRLKIFSPRQGGGLELSSEHDLPVRAQRESGGLRLYSYPVERLRVADRDLYAVGPEAHGQRRIRTLLIDRDADGETNKDSGSEAWSWLPAPEKIVDSWYFALNGRPALIVTTVQADKLGLFEKKKLRVYSLRAGDRSRSGSRPSLKVQTASHQWQSAEPTIVDVNGDGRVDLVLVQPEGLGGKKLIVEAYLGRDNAQFDPLPLRSVIQANHPGTWHYGGHLNSDAAPFLVTQLGPVIQVFPGLIPDKKKRLLEKKARWVIVLPSETTDEDGAGGGKVETSVGGEGGGIREINTGERGLQVLDFDGDGRDDILVRLGGKISSRVHLITINP